MRMRYSALFFVFVLSFALITQGCVFSSNSFLNVVTQMQAQIPAAEAAANTILAIANPALVPLVQPIGTVAQTDLKVLADAIVAYQQSPSTSAKARIEAVVDKLVNEVDAQMLELHKVNNQDALLAIASLGVLDTALHIMDGFVIANQSPKAAKAHALKHQVKLASIYPLLNQPMMEQEASAHHVTVAAVYNTELAYGF